MNDQIDERYAPQPNDTITVHHRVLKTIVRAAASGVEGVLRIGEGTGQWLPWRGDNDDVHLTVQEDDITVDIPLTVNARHNMYDVCLQVQQAISRTIKEYIGMNVKAVNIYIDDVKNGIGSDLNS